MNKQNITSEQVREVFNNKSQHILVTKLLNMVTSFVQQKENLPFIINNIVKQLRKAKAITNIELVKAWTKELNKLLHGTYLWERKEVKQQIAISTLDTAGIVRLIRHHYANHTLMPEPENVINIFMDRELTKQEKTNIRMAKMRAAKKRKAEERKLVEIEAKREEQRKLEAEQPVLVKIEKTGEIKEADEVESAEIEFLKNLQF